MNIEEMLMFLSMGVGMVFLAFMVLMGKTEIKIRFKKMFGLMKNRIVAKEIGKDGKIYTYTPKIENNKIVLKGHGHKKERSYNYDIKNTVVNDYNIREAIFSEITAKQLNPYKFDSQGIKISADEISDMLIMAAAMAMMPKPMFSMKNVPWLLLLAGIGIIAFVLTGGLQT